MFTNLCAGAISLSVSQREACRLAALGDFAGCDVHAAEAVALAAEKSPDVLAGLFSSCGVRPGGVGLPGDWRGTDEAFAEALKTIEATAAVCAAIGATRFYTWIMPVSETLPFKENFAFHAARLKPVAEILAKHGCRIGLEFVGTPSIRKGKPHEFIYTLGGMMELCRALGTGNAGLLLDCWHWYTSGGSPEEIRGLKKDDVVYVHVNDAPKLPLDEQQDNRRTLPGETGVIDIAGFLRALRDIGYDGPVTPEPFSEKVKGLPAELATRLTGGTLAKVWKIAFPA